MSTETRTTLSYPPATEEIVWLHALHAVELCQRAAELAARVHRLGPVGSGGPGWLGGPGWPSAVPASAAPSAG
jgi:hypothetical protein